MAGSAFSATTDGTADPAGWLIVREDGVIVAADERAMTLVGAGTIATLVGRAWPSLVTANDAALLAMAVAAFEHGEAWSGALSFQFDEEPVPLLVRLVPRMPGRGEVAVIHLAPAPPEANPRPTPSEPTDSEHHDLEVLVDAIEASAELRDPEAIGRAVLQSIRPAIRFEWGVVFRLFHQDHLGTPPAAEVVATYPTGLAGVDRGAAWTPLDEAELSLLDSGEPSLDGRLTRTPDEQSPLRRMTAFGMRSRLLVPLFAPGGAGVNGAVALYSTQPVAFSPADGLRLERFVRRLGQYVGPAVQASEAPHVESTSAAAPTGSTTPPPATPSNSEQPSPPTTDSPTQPSEATRHDHFTQLADFAAGVAHELNNPLAAVLGYAQLLPQLGDEERSVALDAIESETLRASEVTRDLLAFARQQPPERRDVYLDAVVSRVLDVLRYEADAAGIEVVTNFAAPGPISADEPQLEQAVLHLLRNALEAMAGGGTLTVATRATVDGARLQVSDTGSGIAPAIAERIFEPFVTSYVDSEHRGMGLAIVHGVVGAHGGRIWFEGLEPHGTRFILELPRSGGATS